MVTAVYFYDVVMALHVAAIVIAFGVTFAFPVIEATLTRTAPRSMPAWHATKATLAGRFITPAMAVALFAGVYMGQDRDLFDRTWVTIPFAILIVLFGLTGAFFTPQARKLAEVGAKDVAASPGDGPVTWSAEYAALSKRDALVGTAAGVMILLAIFLMVAKPGGY